MIRNLTLEGRRTVILKRSVKFDCKGQMESLSSYLVTSKTRFVCVFSKILTIFNNL